MECAGSAGARLEARAHARRAGKTRHGERILGREDT